jgi:hypothetical protein
MPRLSERGRQTTPILHVSAPAFDAEDLEGLRLGQITVAMEKLGFQVVRARRIEDAEIAVQTDVASRPARRGPDRDMPRDSRPSARTLLNSLPDCMSFP